MSKEHTIQFKADVYRLTGSLHLPDTPKPPVIIGCHGLMANRHSPKQVALAQACNDVGIAYFRFDHRGCGDSQGQFEKVTNLEARCEDLSQAMFTLEKMDSVGPLMGLFGSSFGGTTVLNMAARSKIPKLLTFAAPIESRTIRKAAIDHHHHRTKELEAGLEFDLMPNLAHVSNVLVAHGEKDEIVPVQHARTIYACVKDPKQLILQPGGDHRMSDPIHQQTFTKTFIHWFTNQGDTKN